MSGTAVASEPPTRMDVGDEGKNDLTPSQINAYRIAAVIDRLALQFRNASKFDSVEFYNLCLSLARGIDFAVANQEISTRAQELPLLLKQVCQSGNDALLLAAIMVLMISVKNACQNRWFSDRDSEELCNLANQIGSQFCSTVDFNTEPCSSQPTISAIMTRFYPRLKMGQILIFLEVKAGFGAYVRDFQISKQMKHSSDEKARLFIAQTDNTDTPSCLISPPDVNFLLNGKGVDRRTNVFMDTGPQMPTAVTHILKYGSNLLQAVGQFKGNYVIVVALMSELSTVENLVLEDYVQPAATVVDPDSEIIEGPSRISLNCPISFKRIKTPVKGHSCKHLQCFDFDNYMNINSKRPFWRCPHCNHHVCFTDIRIDQNMVKVLKDVGENVNDVIISSDGSWKAIMESDDHAERQQEKFSAMEKDGPEEPGSAIFSNAPPAVLDLTQADDEMDAIMGEAEERKVFPNNSQAQGIAENVTSNPGLTANEVNQNVSTQLEDNFWTGVYLSTFGSASSTLDMQNGGIPEPSSANALVSPVLTDANSLAPDLEAGASFGNALVATSEPESEISSQSALQLQPVQFGNSSDSNDYGRLLSTARNVSRTPIAVQALPAQAPTVVPQRPRMTNLIQSGTLAASETSAAPFSRNMERQQQFSRSPPSSLRQHLYPQNHQLLSVSVQVQEITGLQASNQLRVPYPSTLGSQFQNSSAQQTLNSRLPHTMNYQPPGISSRQTSSLRMPHTANQSAGMFPSSAQSPANAMQSQGQQGSSQGLSSQAIGGLNGQHARMVAAQRAAQVTRTSRIPSLSGNAEGIRVSPVGDQRGSTGSMTQSAARTDASGNSPAVQDWRPSGRMRGSLSGRAYSDALSQYNIQPTQQAQAMKAPSNATPIPPNASSQLQVLLANRAALQAADYPSSARLSSMSGGSGVLPPPSSEMN